MIEGIGFDGRVLLVLGIPVWIVIRTVFLVLTRKNRIKFSLKTEITMLIFVMYILSLAGVVLFPIEIIFADDPRPKRLACNLIPLREIVTQFSNLQRTGFSFGFRVELMIRNIGGNLILLTPLGFLLPVLWERFRRFKNCIIFGVLTSVTIEILQLLENQSGIGYGRITDIDDVILNTAGAAAGYMAFRFLYNFKKKL